MSLETRLIPAHAGKTAALEWPAWRGRAHPRSRGENAQGQDLKFCHLGSSPLTRGKRPPSPGAARASRLIPAHAGKTACDRCAGRVRGAHPRSRGENGLATLAKSLDCGSSPLTRGKLLRGLDRRQRARLIPAHAGKTRPPGGGRTGPAAHPRSRGENLGVRRYTRARRGSSPLTRGKRGVVGWAGGAWGLIPAHAGKTPAPADPTSEQWAHPRSRGENGAVSVGQRAYSGSSPLTRGKRPRAGIREIRSWLIPAHAGKTRRGADPGMRRGAHPRSRGENP